MKYWLCTLFLGCPLPCTETKIKTIFINEFDKPTEDKSRIDIAFSTTVSTYINDFPTFRLPKFLSELGGTLGLWLGLGVLQLFNILLTVVSISGLKMSNSKWINKGINICSYVFYLLLCVYLFLKIMYNVLFLFLWDQHVCIIIWRQLDNLSLYYLYHPIDWSVFSLVLRVKKTNADCGPGHHTIQGLITQQLRENITRNMGQLDNLRKLFNFQTDIGTFLILYFCLMFINYLFNCNYIVCVCFFTFSEELSKYMDQCI